MNEAVSHPVVNIITIDVATTTTTTTTTTTRTTTTTTTITTTIEPDYEVETKEISMENTIEEYDQKEVFDSTDVEEEIKEVEDTNNLLADTDDKRELSQVINLMKSRTITIFFSFSRLEGKFFKQKFELRGSLVWVCREIVMSVRLFLIWNFLLHLA
jgi:hypothetical protein